MRTMLGLYTVVLFLLMLAGFGVGIAIIYDASEHHREMLFALAAASGPMLLGVFTLAALAIIAAIDVAREDQVTATHLVLNQLRQPPPLPMPPPPVAPYVIQR